MIGSWWVRIDCAWNTAPRGTLEASQTQMLATIRHIMKGLKDYSFILAVNCSEYFIIHGLGGLLTLPQLIKLLGELVNPLLIDCYLFKVLAFFATELPLSLVELIFQLWFTLQELVVWCLIGRCRWAIDARINWVASIHEVRDCGIRRTVCVPDCALILCCSDEMVVDSAGRLSRQRLCWTTGWV